MKNRTIAFICPSQAWGGLEMNVQRLAVWLKKRGHNVILYGNPDSVLYSHFQSEGLEVRELRSYSKLGDLFLVGPLIRQLKKDSARIVVLHMNKNFLLTALAKTLSHKSFKFIYMQHMHIGKKKRDLFHRFIYGQVDAWVTPLELFKPIVTERTGIGPERVEVVPYGIVTGRFTSGQPNKSDARERLGIPSDATVVGVVGRLDPKKGQHVLIEACHRLHQQGYRPHALLVGDKSKHEETGYAAQLERMVDEFGLREFVHFRGHMGDIEYAFAAMDIFALTSQSETYGMVTIEAMASQLPVIATSEGGTPGIVNDGVNGLLVESLNVEQLQHALIRLLTDPQLAYRLALQARTDAIAKYSHTHQCDLLEGLFERLMGASA